jgi:hypothetical protein
MPHHNLARVCAATLRRSAIVSMALLPILGGEARASVDVLERTFAASVNQAGVYANEDTGETPSISANGRYVAFESDATNLGEQGPPGVYEAFVKDLDTGEIKLVSRANGVSGEPANEPGEAYGVENLAISGNGRYVLFTSDATNLTTGLPPAGEGEEHPWHVYRRDLQTGETVLVDRVSGPEGAILGEGKPHAEAISEEGRYVLFRDRLEDLEVPAAAHEPGVQTVYVRDMQTGTTITVSRASGLAGELADESSWGRSISADGHYVTFESSATNLVPGMESNAVSQVYRRDLQTGTTILLSGTSTGEPGNQSSEAPILLGEDGCEVIFQSAATNLAPGAAATAPQIYLTNLCTSPVSTTLVSRADGEDGPPVADGGGVTALGASAEGPEVLFEATFDPHGSATAAERRLYVRDLSTGRTMLVDRASGPEGELANEEPEEGAISAAIAADGCRVAFVTRATNLAEPGPPLNDPSETYVRQLTPCEPSGQEPPPAGEGGQEVGGGANVGHGEQPTTGGESSVSAGVIAAAECVVPGMRALVLRAIRRALHAAHCALGRLAYRYSTIPKGRLVAQSLHRRAVRPAGTKIEVWLSKGPRRRRASARRRP